MENNAKTKTNENNKNKKRKLTKAEKEIKRQRKQEKKRLQQLKERKEAAKQGLREEYYRKFGPYAEGISVMFYNAKPEELDNDAIKYLNANRDSYITRYKTKLKQKEQAEALAKKERELESKVDLDKIMSDYELLPVSEINYKEYLKFKYQIEHSRKEAKDATLKIYGETLLDRFRDAENYSASRNRKKVTEEKKDAPKISEKKNNDSYLKQIQSQVARESALQTAMRKLWLNYTNGTLEIFQSRKHI